MAARLITLTEPQSQAAEAYRTLRTNLMLSNVDAPPNCLAVAGATLNDSPNPVAANLAVAMAQSDRRTLLVDADLRRPHLHEVFELDNSRGLTTMLQDGDRSAIQASSQANLWVLTSGPRPISPTDLLESKKMTALLSELRSEYEVVLFNAPPVIAVTDAALLGSKLDGVLLVMTAGRTRRDQAQQARDLLTKVKVAVVGAVLVNAPGQANKAY